MIMLQSFQPKVKYFPAHLWAALVSCPSLSWVCLSPCSTVPHHAGIISTQFWWITVAGQMVPCPLSSPAGCLYFILFGLCHVFTTGVPCLHWFPLKFKKAFLSTFTMFWHNFYQKCFSWPVLLCAARCLEADAPVAMITSCPVFVMLQCQRCGDNWSAVHWRNCGGQQEGCSGHGGGTPHAMSAAADKK